MKYIATALVTVLILVAVLLPGSQVPDIQIVGIDKVAHFFLFALWAVAVRHDFDLLFKWYWVIAAGAAFSLLTEVLQIAVEGRTFDTGDILFDTLGLIFGILIGKFSLRIIRRVLTR